METVDGLVAQGGAEALTAAPRFSQTLAFLKFHGDQRSRLAASSTFL